MSNFLDDPSRIEVHAFGVVAETVTDIQLQKLGEEGFSLIDGWPLNEEDYGPDQNYYIFKRWGV